MMTVLASVRSGGRRAFSSAAIEAKPGLPKSLSARTRSARAAPWLSISTDRLTAPLLTSPAASLSSSHSHSHTSVRLMSSSDSAQEGQDVALAMESLKQADAVCFDVDSTVIDEEGIDVLADHLGQGPAVAALTQQAMEGGMAFQDALAARLELLKPSRKAIQECLAQHPLRLTPNMEELCQTLQDQGKHVYLVSGGFRIMIQPVADRLNIPHERIFANTLFFDQTSGDYQGFDANEPTSADMGKPKALQIIQEAGNYKCMVMVGDGATDAQAKPPAKAFIGFGGVAIRQTVRDKADWFVHDFADVLQVLKP